MEKTIKDKNTIIILTHNLDIGGVQKSVAMLANNQIQFNKVIVILLENHREIRHELDSMIEIVCVETLSADVTKKDIGEQIFQYRLAQLNKLFKKYPSDIVISFEDYSNILVMKSSCAGKRILSCRITLDQYIYFPQTHLLPHSFYYENISKLYINADAIVCVSDRVKADIESKVASEKIFTIYNGLNLSKIDAGKSKSIEITRPYILNVGRLHDQKGQADLLKAFSLISGEISHDLVLIGDGPNRNKLVDLAESLLIANRVHFMGKIDEPYAYMLHADLFVFPSIIEGFSNTVLEAMYCEAGVISTSYPGHNEILNDYGNICQIGDIPQLAEKMILFLQNHTLLEKLRAVQKKDIALFTVEKTYHQYNEVINRVMNG